MLEFASKVKSMFTRICRTGRPLSGNDGRDTLLACNLAASRDPMEAVVLRMEVRTHPEVLEAASRGDWEGLWKKQAGILPLAEIEERVDAARKSLWQICVSDDVDDAAKELAARQLGTLNRLQLELKY
jgi:hypothetical protein